MKYRNLFVATAVVATSLFTSPAVYAATSVHSPVRAMFGKTKNVKLTFLNDTGSPMELKAGEEVIKLEAGKPTTVSVPEGTKVVSNTATATHQVGSLITEVNTALNGATIHIK